MEPEMLVIEEHTEDGVVWGVSVSGPNPPADEFVRCRTEDHAWHVKRFYDIGKLEPFLRAAGAISDDVDE